MLVRITAGSAVAGKGREKLSSCNCTLKILQIMDKLWLLSFSTMVWKHWSFEWKLLLHLVVSPGDVYKLAPLVI